MNATQNNSSTAIPAEEITRVKGLGFLMDKRTGNTFNGRVITRNGKITSREMEVIAEAAKRFGSGEITMTARLTVEIQGVPFDNIEPLREYLREQAGLETGGTGAKVRPVVSCKGTTCQYGLIDTFDLSDFGLTWRILLTDIDPCAGGDPMLPYPITLIAMFDRRFLCRQRIFWTTARTSCDTKKTWISSTRDIMSSWPNNRPSPLRNRLFCVTM